MVVAHRPRKKKKSIIIIGKYSRERGRLKWNEKRIKGTRGNGSYPMLFQRRAFRFGQNTKNKQKERKKKIYDVYSGEAMVPSRVPSSPLLSSPRMATNTRFLDKKKKEEKTHGVLIITGRVSSVLSTILLVPRCVTSLPPATIGGKGETRGTSRFPTAPSPPSTPSSANISLFRVSLKVWKCGALTSESRFANIRERERERMTGETRRLCGHETSFARIRGSCVVWRMRRVGKEIELPVDVSASSFLSFYSSALAEPSL